MKTEIPLSTTVYCVQPQAQNSKRYLVDSATVVQEKYIDFSKSRHFGLIYQCWSYSAFLPGRWAATR